jgi:hypothetical protein
MWKWSCLKGHVPIPQNDGRPRVHGLLEILNAIFFIETHNIFF